MLDWFLELLKNPEFQIIVATYAGTKLLDSTGSKIKQLKDLSKKGTPEWQFLTCLERAFFTTETQLGWEHKTEAIYESFEDALLSHQGFFTITSLKEIFEAAVGHPVTEADLAAWVANFKRELAMGDYPALIRFLSIDHMLQPQTSAQANQPNYILTSSASIYNNPEIICRDEFIDDLLQLLSSGHKRVQITGMGGLGKTESLTKLFAKLAADKQHSSFDHIAFIRFSGDILSDIESQIDYQREYMGFKGIEAAKRFLHDICAEKGVLLCIDDIRKNQEIVREDNPLIQYLRSLGAYVVLAARAGFPDFERNDLSFLSTKACKELFEKKFGKAVSDANDIEVLNNIIEDRAGNHTLIINRLGNMAKDYGWSIPALAEKLEEKDFNFQKGIADEELLQHEINKLYQVNDELSVAEKNILEAFAIFPAVPLAVDLCVEWLHEDAKVDSDNCTLTLNKLVEKTWLEERSDAKDTASFVMHQLVRTAVQEQTIIEYSNHQNLVEKCNASLYESNVAYLLQSSSVVIPFAIQVHDILFQEKEPFAFLSAALASFYNNSADYSTSLAWYQKSLTILEKVLGKDHPDTATTYNNIACVYDSKGQYDLALEWYQKALVIYEKALGKEHPDTATTYNNIAGVYDSQGQYDLALEWYQKALSIVQRVLGEDHPYTASTYNNIAGVYKNQGKYDLALEWYQKDLVISEKVLGKDHPSTATTYNNIALAYDNQGQYDLALEWYQKALSIVQRVLGEDHPYTATTYNNIASVYDSQGQYDLALEWYQKALVIREKVLGKDHPDTATTYNNIAGVYDSQGQYDLALEWYQKALDAKEKVLDKDHPSTATTYNNIASAYYSQGQYDLALEWYQKDLAISEKVLGKNHPDTATTYNNIASVYYSQGQYDLALEWYQKALVIYEKVLGKDHPDTAGTYNNIALVYKNQGKYDLALEWYQKALGIYEKAFGNVHPNTATNYNNIAGVYKNQGQYDLALEWYQKDLAISEKVLGKNHPDTATTYNNIAGVYKRQGQYDLALEWYLKALAIREKVLGKDHPDIATTYNNIASVYDNQGQYDIALEWYQKALSIVQRVLDEDHPYTATTYNNIAVVYYNQKKLELALKWFQKARSIWENKLGKDHPYTKGTKEAVEFIEKLI